MTLTTPVFAAATQIARLACLCAALAWAPLASWAQSTGSVSGQSAAQAATPKQVQALEQLEKLLAVRMADAEKAANQKHQEREDKLKKLEDDINIKKELNDIRKDVTTNAQKAVDWWLVVVGLFFAAFGVLVPFAVIQRQNAQHKSAMAELKVAIAEVQQVKQVIDADRDKVASTLQDATYKAEKVNDIAKAMELIHSTAIGDKDNQEPTHAQQVALIEATKAIKASPDASLADKLFANSVEAAKRKNWVDAAIWFAACATTNPKDHRTLYGWGFALGQLAEETTGAERQRLRGEQIAKYAAAVAVKPDFHEVLNDWGIALGQMVDEATGSERQRLRSEQIAKYAAAAEVEPDNHMTLNNWGIALGHLADEATGSERDRLRSQEIAKYDAAVEAKPDYHVALNNWGNALGKLADEATGAERQCLRDEEISKYADAVAAKPEYHLALSNWGYALSKLAQDSTDVGEREKLLTEAQSKYDDVSRIRGRPIYNQACIAALRGEVLAFIQKADALAAGDLPTPEHMRADRDLDAIRQSPEFVVWWTKRFGSPP